LKRRKSSTAKIAATTILDMASFRCLHQKQTHPWFTKWISKLPKTRVWHISIIT
jgi:hypothetical protein